MTLTSVLAKTAIGIVIVDYFMLVWWGLYLSSAISSGALDEPQICINGALLRHEAAGTVSQSEMDNYLTRQVWYHLYDRAGSQGTYTRQTVSIYAGLILFRSAEQRREDYRRVATRFRPCSGTLYHLRRMGGLTPEIQAFVEGRYKILGLPMPPLDRPEKPNAGENR